jgi:hypothetical protein
MYTITDRDHLDLWKYFQDRADNVKEAMFHSVTWSIGFAAAVFGFIITTRLDLSKWRFTAPESVAGASFLGFLLCVYSLILVEESRKHILSNWDRAKCCKSQIIGLDAILDCVPPESKSPERKSSDENPMRYVWNQVFCVIDVFTVLFVVLFIWALKSWSS